MRLRTAKAFASTLIQQNKPGYLILYVNNICNLRCHMCLAWDQMQKKTNDLSLYEHVQLSKSFRNLVQLTITGGEPTLRDDVPEIIHAYYINSGLAKCTLVTNATYPDKTINCVRKILKLCPDIDLSVNVSIDGLPDVHEQIRGIKGCFDKTIKSLEFLLEIRRLHKNMTVNVTTVISKMNFESVEEVYRFILHRFEVDHHFFLLVRGKTKDQKAKNFPLEAYNKIIRLIEHENNRSKHYLSLPVKMLSQAMRSSVSVIAESGKYMLPCVAGSQFIEILSDGEVVPCEIIESKRDPHIGNVRDYNLDINKLLQSSKAVEMRNFIKFNKCCCTFECTLIANLAFNPLQYHKILAQIWKKTYIIFKIQENIRFKFF